MVFDWLCRRRYGNYSFFSINRYSLAHFGHYDLGDYQWFVNQYCPRDYYFNSARISFKTSLKNCLGDEFYLDDFHGGGYEYHRCSFNGWGNAHLVGSADYAFCGINYSLAV